MMYRVIGLMSGSSLDGLDIAFVEFNESRGIWSYEIKAAECLPYNDDWIKKLSSATGLNAYNYLLLHAAFGKYAGEQINLFIDRNNLHHQVQLVGSHGHTTFHAPQLGMTGQLGDGATIAAVTGLNVVSDLRAMDVAFGGQGAPIVPVGEKLLFSDYSFFLNIGGIANISYRSADNYIAYDICAANKVLNMLAELEGKLYDDSGAMASGGNIITPLLTQLNALEYYKKPFPKSLANSFGIDEVFPIVQTFDNPVEDKLRTYAEHIAMQVSYAVQQIIKKPLDVPAKMLVTGGGAFNNFLVKRLQQHLEPYNLVVEVPGDTIINYKEALVMALLGVLRWREEYTVMKSVTGATRNSIGGAVWIGQEA